jgi:DNA modification methylase
MPDNSVDMIMTSIPFGNHYEYTESLEDLGHNPSDMDFWQQMDYLTPQLLRVLKPGRIAVIHVKDRVVYRYQTESEMMEISPFTAECILHFRKHKWMYFGQRTIVTDVVRENNSSYRLGWSEADKDMTKMGSGLPEYALVFRKKPSDTTNSYADEPVEHTKEHYTRARWQTDAHSFWRSDGNTPLDIDQLYNYFQDVATKEALDRKNQLSSTFMVNAPKSPHSWVLTDVDFMHTFNSEQVRKKRSKHICPLPFDIVERFVEMYSNKGDTVLDPFGGLFTVPVTAMHLGRKGYGIELNPEYYAAGVKYCEAEQRNQLMPSLFDFFNVKVGAE